MLRKKKNFEWTPGYGNVFESLKKIFATPLVLTQPPLGETLYLYLEVVEEDVSVVLIKESDFTQSHMFFISKSLEGAEMWHRKI